jgi:hypothetical protein
MKELARRGHQVTVFSPFPEKYPIQNITDIEFKLTYPELQQKLGEHKSSPLKIEECQGGYSVLYFKHLLYTSSANRKLKVGLNIS